MFPICVFRAEAEAGLGDLIRSTASVKSSAKIKAATKFDLPERTLAGLQHHTKASVTDFDLHYLTTVLATTGWNDNDDIFDRVETWLARATAEDKPVNYEHVQSDIVGHMTSSKAATDPDLAEIAADTIIDDLPAKFHVVSGAVLYKIWEDTKLQERMDLILTEIAKGEWSVSMECLFRGFDYALRDADGITQFIQRAEATAFLTKHLRAYGGSGTYQSYKLGRVLRNFVFSGKGLTKTPANPDSQILLHPEPLIVTAAKLPEFFAQVSAAQVYSHVDATSSTESQQEIANVADTELQKLIDTLKAENEQLKASAKENDIKSFKSANDTLTAEVKTLSDKVTSLTESTKATEAAKVKTETELAEANKSLTEVRDELKNIYAEQKKADRLAKLTAALKNADAETVAAMAVSLASLTDEQFAAYLASQAKLVVAAVEAPVVKKVEPGVENATAAVLDAVVPTAAPALAVAASEATKDLAKHVAACFSDE